MRAFALAAAATAVNAEVYFKEDFNSGADEWTQSTWKGSEMGEMESCAPEVQVDEDNKALCTKKDARFYGASKSFDTFSNKGKKLIVQFTVKQEKDIECGGGYVKLGPKMEDAKKFGDPTEYNIMFGPDKCGYTKKTHVIFNYNGKNVEKTTALDYKQEVGETQLYRLTLDSDNSVKVDVGGEELYKGEMEKDWDLLEPKEIRDPDEKKPSDWVDEAMMDDPKAEKPKDWVEEDQKEIPDADAKQPEDWDEEEDGEWEAPMKPNSDYKGPWKAEQIANPDYKGPWEAKLIANPKYKADDNLYLYKEFGFIGFDLWQVKSGSIYDDVIITDDEKEADKLVEDWKKLNAAEKEKKEVEAKKTAEKAAAEAKDKKDDTKDDLDDVDADDDADDDQDL